MPQSSSHGLLDSDLWTAALEALANVWRKLQLLVLGLLHLFFSTDSRWSQQPHDATPSTNANDLDSNTDSDVVKTRTKRIIFVRHAESEWNVVFNRGIGWRAGVRLLRAIVREWLLVPTADSLFIDSPLSRRGLSQATALADHVMLASEEELCDAPPAHWLQYLGSALPHSIVVASNLRRAIDTARVASAARLELPGEQLHVLSSLQEMGRNMDTLTLGDAYSVPRTTVAGKQSARTDDERFDVRGSHGNKAVRGSARTRLDAFVRWAFAREQETVAVLVVYGHSHWFRAFCQAFLPHACDHPVKTEKLANCSVVTFELVERRAADGRTAFNVPPASFQYVR